MISWNITDHQIKHIVLLSVFKTYITSSDFVLVIVTSISKFIVFVCCISRIYMIASGRNCVFFSSINVSDCIQQSVIRKRKCQVVVMCILRKSMFRTMNLILLIIR